VHLDKKAMRNLKIVITIFCFCFLVSAYTINGQDMTNDDFIGNWYFLGPNKVNVNDTLELVKELSKPITMDYTQWELTDSNYFFLTYYKISSIKDSKFITVVENKKDRDIWHFDTTKNQLLIKNSIFEQFYSILSFSKKNIKLIKIK
jgi:hypothetical protein